MRKGGVISKGKETINRTNTTGGETEKEAIINQGINTSAKLKETEIIKMENNANTNNQENHQEITDKHKSIYEYYCDKKRNINEKNSSFLISLPELNREYEINFRRILLGLLINLPGEGEGYRNMCKIILYKFY